LPSFKTKTTTLMMHVIASMLIFAAAPVFAQEAGESQSAVIAQVEALQEQVKSDLQEAAKSLEALQKSVDDAASADAELSKLRVQADAIVTVISNAMGKLERRFNLVAKRLEELGKAPADGKVEDVGLTSDRKRLTSEQAQMNTILTDGETLDTAASALSTRISELRRKLFTETLLRRTEITAEVLDETRDAARGETEELVNKTQSSLDFMWNYKRNSLFAALFLSLAAAVFFRALVRWVFAPLIRSEVEHENPAYITRLSRAFWSTLIPTIAIAAFVATSLFLLDYFNVLREDIEQIFQALLWVLAAIYFVYRLADSVVAPRRPGWRLIDVSDRGARTLVIFASMMAVVNGIAYFVGEATEALDSPLVLSVAKGFVSSVIIGLLLIALAFVKPMRAHDGGADLRWPRFIRIVFLIGGIALILTSLIGYIGLAQFASTQIVVTGALLITIYIGFLTGHAISKHNVFRSTSAGRYLAEKHGVDDIRLDQLGLVIGLVIYAFVVIWGLPLIMLQWGFQSVDIWSLFVRLFTEIKIGNITISLLGILVGLLLFVAGYFATRWFQKWLDRNVMARSHFDVGVRNSVNTALGYAGIALAGVIAISAAGINLSSLALVAGALSLGIGFGLQTIVSNFVSGLILLAERPFKVGDWIVAGTTEGFVRRISVRATEVETFQNQSIIVPNSQLINASVGNWTLRNTLARSEVAVKVSYESDPRKVMDILLDIATSHPLVLTMPEPNVGFTGFGEFALEFELRFYLADLFTGGAVRNDIRLEIIERFRAEGIEIPYQQRNVNVHVVEEDEGSAIPAKEDMSPEAKKQIREQADRRRKASEAKARDIDKVDDGNHPEAHGPGELHQKGDDDGDNQR
jgi:small-conductance mechanosensitive channel